MSDKSWDVRRQALRQIATRWKQEPGTFELFYDNALNDPFERQHEFQDNPRQTALEPTFRTSYCITRGYKRISI